MAQKKGYKPLLWGQSFSCPPCHRE